MTTQSTYKIALVPGATRGIGFETAVHPGSRKTDMNSSGDMEVTDRARSNVAMALFNDAGPSGAFVHLGEVLPW